MSETTSVFLIIFFIFLVHQSTSEFSSSDCTQNVELGSKSCFGFFRVYHWNDNSQSCEEQVYGGCNASNNNFKTLKQCQEVAAAICKKKCCQECARTEGEPCGGDLGFSGTCEPGLSCQQPGPSPSEGTCRPIIFDNHEDT